MSECNQDGKKKGCACIYESCFRRGKCCECLEYHLIKNELPGCAFAKISKDAESSYNRDFEYFAQLVLRK